MKKQALVLALSAALLGAASLSSVAVADEEKVLNIYNWPDYIPDGMLQAFEKETGIKVNYDTFETNEALHAKLVAGNSGYDIVVPGSEFGKIDIAGGLLQPLDKAKIPNYANLDPEFMKMLDKADPGNKYLTPWAWGFTTVGINRTRVEKALKGAPLPDNPWELVFNPEYTSKLKSCGIAYLDSPFEIMPIVLRYLGKDPASTDPKVYAEANAMLANVRKDIRIFSSTMIDDLAGGRACAAIGWSGDINIAADRAKELKSKEKIEALLPKGALLFVDTMAIPKDAKHVENAYKWINFYLRPENAAAMANDMNYPTGNRAALDKIKPEIVNNKTIFVDSSYLASMIQPGFLSNESRELMGRAYNTFKAGKQ